MSGGTTPENFDYLLNNRSDFSLVNILGSAPQSVQNLYNFIVSNVGIQPSAHWVHRDNLPPEIPGGNENVAIRFTGTTPLGKIKAVSKLLTTAPSGILGKTVDMLPELSLGGFVTPIPGSYGGLQGGAALGRVDEFDQA